MSYDLDDAAARALYLAQLHGAYERVGLLYADGSSLRATESQGQHGKNKATGAFQIPRGSLRAIFHTHPPRGRTFSDTDKDQARKLGVPSYIASGHALRRYDPSTGRAEDVLAQIPIDLILEGAARHYPLLRAYLESQR